MSEMKNLAKQTAIYGISNILGKFLNWCLVPLYTYILESSAEYGTVTNLYAWTALLLVILTYGMETGFFRFANKEGEDAIRVYSNTIICIATTSILFALLALLFAQPLANLLGYADHSEYISYISVIVAIDAFCCIPFAFLRYQNKSFKFAILKLLNILVTITLNLFFLLGCPYLMEHAPATVEWFYNPNYGVGYVFVANLIASLFCMLTLLPEITKAKFQFDKALLKQMLNYSLPLLLLGIAGIMNQTADKIVFPYLIDDPIVARSELGIYGACFKVAMVMMVFTQAFRYAYEPYVFAQNKNGDKKKEYADAMKFFIIFSLLIFLGMMFYLDILKFIIKSDYWAGLRVIPIVLMSYIFQGIFFNLSIWYKLVDKTKYGAYLSFLGMFITFFVNIAFVPTFSYMASAAASFCCYFIIMLISYLLGQKYYPIHYDLKSIGIYFIVAMALFGISQLVADQHMLIKYGVNTLLLLAYIVFVIKRDLPLHAIPVIGKFAKKQRE
ncbi:MAG: polysaccharide biosynthesis C-terminal domain-containing protein [Paludibacteraceae bacterium]|nr:polysaccharide biosynthesis C-terminal domain-containing protein [Paludibacteraceae bacterium]